MNKELQRMLDDINTQVQKVKDLVGEGKLTEAKEAKAKLVTMQEKFDILKDLEDKKTEEMTAKAKEGKAKVVSTVQDSVKNFADAARTGFRVSNKLESGMRESSDEDGGYIVPEDIQTKINQYKSAEASLEDLIDVENVTSNKGARTFEKKSTTTGFTDIEEGGELKEMETPEFERLKYAITDRGGYIPITNDLLNDTDQNITEIITRWIARKSNATSNSKILTLAKTKTAADIETMDEINRAIIVTLGAAYRSTTKLLTNDDGLFFLSNLKDTTGRPLLNPNPKDTMEMVLSVGPVRVPIVAAANSIVSSDIETAGKIKIPFICGDFKEAFKKFDRQITTIMSSNVAAAGKLNAFTQNLTLVRAIERNDFRVKDVDAFVNLNMVVSATTVPQVTPGE